MGGGDAITKTKHGWPLTNTTICLLILKPRPFARGKGIVDDDVCSWKFCVDET